MVPSTADDTAAGTEQEDAAQADEQIADDSAADDQAADDQAAEDTSTEARSDDGSDESSASGEKIGDRDDDDSHAGEPVDVAPDPERTGIDVDKAPRLDELTEEEVEEIRKERLDPDNRPDNVEVDNTQRDFDTELGRFEDSDEDPPETAPFIDPEKPSNQGDDASDDDASDDDKDDAEGAEQDEKEPAEQNAQGGEN